MSNHLYFHSPFSETYVYQRKDRALLLSFILAELKVCAESHTTTWHFSLSSLCKQVYDAPLNRLQEHVKLLPYAFPMFRNEGIELQETLSLLRDFLIYRCFFTPEEYLQKLFVLLDPFIQECKEEEHFLLFLLEHYDHIKTLTPKNYLLKLFYSLCPEGLGALETNLCDHFHKKGFSTHLLTIAERIKQLSAQEAICESTSC